MTKNDVSSKRSLGQLVLVAVCGILTAMLVGNLISNALSTRDYVRDQLHAHARDAATSLGLSLSTVIDARDAVLAGRMIDAIYDSGDFKRILYTSVSSEVIHQTVSDAQEANVPIWFRDLLELKVPVASAQVMAGWEQLGELYVESSTAQAYEEMWQSVKSQFIWFLMVLLISVGLVFWLLSRLLKPLKEVEYQAHQMEQKNFDYRLPEQPTRELAKVAGAINEMAASLGKVFDQQLRSIESLRSETLHDAVTGLYNREGFDKRLAADLKADDDAQQGTLLLLQIRDFARINEEFGREQGDAVLSAVAQVIENFVTEHEASYGARRSGADFCIFVPGVLEDTIVQAADKLMGSLSGLQWVKQMLREDLLFMGVAGSVQDESAGTLFSKADIALREAQAKGVSGWQRYGAVIGESVDAEVREANRWHKILQQALTSGDLELYAQNVVMTKDGVVQSRQILARLRAEGELIPASVFIPMARRFALMVDLDRQIIARLLERIPGLGGSYGISLSESSVMDEGFVSWLQGLANESPSLLGRMIFHIPEYVLRHGEPQVASLASLVERVGGALVIERFGASSVPFSYLQRLKIQAIKVDHSFVRGIDQNSEHQFFLRSAIQLAHSQNVQVVAVGVETEAEYAWLQAAGVDGVMGYFLDRPSELSGLSG